METVNQMFNKLIAQDPYLSKMFTSPSYRFYSNKNKDRYFYTVGKVKHKNGLKYVAGIYRFLKTKKQYKLVKRIGFAKRYKAKEKAYQLYLKEKATSPEVA